MVLILLVSSKQSNLINLLYAQVQSICWIYRIQAVCSFIGICFYEQFFLETVEGILWNYTRTIDAMTSCAYCNHVVLFQSVLWHVEIFHIQLTLYDELNMTQFTMALVSYCWLKWEQYHLLVKELCPFIVEFLESNPGRWILSFGAQANGLLQNNTLSFLPVYSHATSEKQKTESQDNSTLGCTSFSLWRAPAPACSLRPTAFAGRSLSCHTHSSCSRILLE